MSIMTDARLRLLECRVVEIERRLVEISAVPALAVADGTASRPAAKPKPGASAQKTSKRSRKTP